MGDIKFFTGVAFILKKDNKILLFKRNIPNRIAFGKFALPGGTVENNETIKQAVCREAKEELGIEIHENDIAIVHIQRLHEKLDGISQETKSIIILHFVEIKKWKSDPLNLEPDKHSDLAWFDPLDLPNNMFDLNIFALNDINSGIFYNEHSWHMEKVG